MLGDIKSFFTKSSVGEVTVGLTIGAAFTNVMTAATEAGRGLLSGDADYGGLVQALVALLAAAAFSLFAVIKPLARLKAAADRTQVDLVARAAGDEATLTAPLADEGVDDGLIADTSADPTLDSTLEEEVEGADAVVVEGVDPSEASGDLLAGTDEGDGAVAIGEDPLTTVAATGRQDSRPTPSAAYAWAGGDGADGTALERVAVSEDTSGEAAPDGASSERPSDPAVDEPTGDAPTPEAPTVLRAAPPHSHPVTKVCPYCAFDIPAVASRCGYCTADLTDAQRVAGVVLVDQQSP